MNALVSDIDHTLVFDGQIKEDDEKAIKKYQKNHLFGVCTGRPLCALDDVKKLDLDFYILSTGALILDKRMNIIQHTPMNKETAKNIFLDYFNQADMIIQTGNRNIFYATFHEKNHCCCQVIHHFEEVEHEVIYGISLIFKDEMTTKKELDSIYRYGGVMPFQNKNSIDIVSIGCSKGQGIKEIKKALHIEHISGIGDSYNDLSLFEASDYCFTFHSSPSDLKDKVDVCVNNIKEATGLLAEAG